VDRSYYSERIDRGGAILAVTTDEAHVEDVRRLMESEGGDVEASKPPRRETGRAMRVGLGQREGGGVAAGEKETEEVLPIVEECLRIGKRPVGRRSGPRL
jgi:hypothetical protein